MPRNAFLDETKSRQITVNAPGWRGNVRVQPTIEAILDEARPATEGKGDQLIHGTLKYVLMEAIVDGKLRWVHDTLGRVLGGPPPSGGSPPERGKAA